LILVDPAQF